MAAKFSKVNINLKNIFFFSVILVVNFLLRIPITALGFFALTYDQGRDLLLVSNIVYNHNLTLIGPTTGLQGIFYGPYWYYFLTPIFQVAHGDPQIIGTIFGFLGIGTIVATYFYLKSTLKFPLLAFFYTLTQIPKNPSKLNFFLLGLISFIIVDFEFPWGCIMILFTLALPLLFRKHFLKKQYLFTLLGFLLVLSPRILFNLRNNFLELKSLVNYFNEPKIYCTVLPLWQRVIQRLDVYLGNFSESFSHSDKILGLMILFFL